MRKKLLCMVLSAAMLLGLSSCSGLPELPGSSGSKEPTAAELMENVEELEAGKYNCLSMKMDVEAQQDGQDATLSMDGDIETTGDILHMSDMKMEIGMTGMNVSVDMEVWFDMEESVTYMNMSALGQETGWVKSEIDDTDETSETAQSLVGIVGNVSDLRDDAEFTLEEHEKGEDYVVTWSVDGDDLEEAMGDLLADYDDVKLSNADAKAVFDSESQKLKSVSVTTSADMDDDESSVELEIGFKEVNSDKELEIPKKVIKEAVSSEGELPEIAPSDDPEDDPDSEEEDFRHPNGNEDEDIGLDDDEDEATRRDDEDEDTRRDDDEDEDTRRDDDEDEDTGRDDEDEDVTNSEGVTSDGEGTDKVIDAIAARLAAADPDNKGVNTYHYDGMASLSYYASSNGTWSGSIEIDRLTDPDFWGSPKEKFEKGVANLKKWTDSDPISSDSKSAVFMTKDSFGSRDLDYVGYDDDLFIEISVYSFDECSKDDMLDYLDEMMDRMD